MRKSVDCFACCMTLYGFVQAKHCLPVLNVGVLPLIVHAAPCCGLHCFYLQCCQIVLLIVQSWKLSLKLNRFPHYVIEHFLISKFVHCVTSKWRPNKALE